MGIVPIEDEPGRQRPAQLPGAGTVVTSQPLLDELEHTLRSTFTPGPAAAVFLEQLRRRVRVVPPRPLPARVSCDADDDVVLATAVAANATVIVTGDDDLLGLGRYEGIDILTPRDLLTRLVP